MIIVTGYQSKKELKTCVGKALRYQETSMFGDEFKANGTFCVAHRPAITRLPGREFFAEVTMKDGLIASVK